MNISNFKSNFIYEYYDACFTLKEIRDLAEQGVVIWNSGITKSEINDLVKIQKIALRIILGAQYKSYKSARNFFKIDPLSIRRSKLSTQFAIKLYKSDKSDRFFKHVNKAVKTRTDQPLVIENFCNTTKAYNAPHNYLTRLVNQNKSKNYEEQKVLIILPAQIIIMLLVDY